MHERKEGTLKSGHSGKKVTSLKAMYKGLSQTEKVAFRKIFENQAEELVSATSRAMYDSIKAAIKNKTFTLAKVPVTQRANLREFLTNIIVTAGIFGGAIEYQRQQAEAEVDRMLAEMKETNSKIAKEMVPPKD